MRILIYGLNYSPELTGIGKYTGEMSSWLAQRGHEVRVVTAPPYYPAWSIREDYRGKLYRTEEHPGEPLVYRTPLYVPAKPTGLKRMAHLFSFMLGSLPVMLRQCLWKPDIVFTVEPTFFGAPLALLVARATGAASWLHVQDFEVDAAFDLGLLPAHGPIHSIALGLEQAFTRAFTRVSSISHKMVERAVAKGVPPDQVTLFPNWVDVDAVHPQDVAAPNSFRRQLNLDGKTILLYSGNMGAKQGLELLAPLAASFENDPRVHFLFCGDGAFRPTLELLVSHRPNVTLLPLQPLERLNDLLNAADIHLLPQRAGAADLVMPSKLTGMLSSGRPVIATADSGTQVARVVSGESPQQACGLVVPAETPSALHAAVQRLIEDPALRSQLGANARHYAVQNLGRTQVLEQFERDVHDLASPIG
ncbi:glycosyltransferase WbuB [Edaphobacter modestus]|uniref:Colanic acid biosynthesis glycosyl transferase WcaI n=1 Tax=Edaphobacter modestus TaxID=388466 RepID=A0A4Q7YS33_9BACT|nr:glycosyltransferase WbuB [Edaphobacter modestus]RZU39733.1 colanic acid biosynthesis glycosyl transferase WcaI [Edaphobacter modestus]